MGVSIIDRNASFVDYLSRTSTISVAPENQQVFILSMIDTKFASERVLSRNINANVTSEMVSENGCKLTKESVYWYTRPNADYTVQVAVTLPTVFSGSYYILGGFSSAILYSNTNGKYYVRLNTETGGVTIECAQTDVITVRLSNIEVSIQSSLFSKSISLVNSDISDKVKVPPVMGVGTAILHSLIEYDKYLSDDEVQQSNLETKLLLKAVGVVI